MLLSKLALSQSPGYLDIMVFLGRVYYWNNQTDSSLQVLQAALFANPGYLETSIAIADIEYYRENYNRSLDYVEKGLSYNPAAAELLLRKSKCLSALSRFSEAVQITRKLVISKYS